MWPEGSSSKRGLNDPSLSLSVFWLPAELGQLSVTLNVNKVPCSKLSGEGLSDGNSQKCDRNMSVRTLKGSQRFWFCLRSVGQNSSVQSYALEQCS